MGFAVRVVQGLLAHKTPPPPLDPTVALCLGTYGDPMGVGVSYERGTPVHLAEVGVRKKNEGCTGVPRS